MLSITKAYLRPIKCLFISSLLLLPFGAHAKTTALTKTKSELKLLETKISNLQRTLSHAHDKNSVLNHELANTEKNISEGMRQLGNIQSNIDVIQHKIVELQHQVNQLNEELHAQQYLLAKHVRARYVMGEYQPLKWLLNQDNPATSSRLLTFHQYIVKSRQHIIDSVHETSKKLTISEENLRLKIAELQQLQQRLNNHQQKLAGEKRYHIAIIESLNKDILSNQNALNNYQHNKENLSRLLNTLIQQSNVQPRYPFVSMRKKLQRPINVRGSSVREMNQGLIFFTTEGTPVSAVYPGKVVFSDWLNGYGLLLILDHGQGFMTLYAHNQSLFKQKGSFVNQGEQIASVGHSGGLKQNGLYFEIRQRGKAIPPLKWLSSI